MRALVDAGHDVKAMTRHPETYDGPGRPVRGDVGERASLTEPLEDVDVAYYLVHSLDNADFEEARRRRRADVRQGRGEDRRRADRLPRRSRQRAQRRVVRPPPVAPRGGGAARIDRHPGHGAACRDRGRQGRHLLGDDPAAGQEAPGDGGAEVGGHPHPADRDRRRGLLPCRCRRQREGDGSGLRDRWPGGAELRGDAPAGGHGDERARAPGGPGAGADAAALLVLAGAGDRRRHSPRGAT